MTDTPPTGPIRVTVGAPTDAPAPADSTAPKFSDVRAVVVLLIMTLFGLAFAAMLFVTPPPANHDAVSQFQGALILAFGAAYGYYLSNSSGAAQAREQVGKALDVVKSQTGSGQ